MQQSKLSLPNVDNLFSYVNNLEVDVISELHHGNWWRNSWREANCDPQKNKILVPIILYMDGISLDTHGRLSLTPLNMTLGIFSTETQKLNYAWETLYFHPQLSNLASSLQHPGLATPTSIVNLGIASDEQNKKCLD